MIRTARSNDMLEIKSLAKNLRISFGPSAKMANLGPVPDLRNYMSTGRVFILREGVLKGYMVCYPVRDCYYIDRIELAEKAQRDGSPRKLMTFAEARAHEQDCKYLAIWNNPSMEDYMAICVSQGHQLAPPPQGGMDDRLYFEM